MRLYSASWFESHLSFESFLCFAENPVESMRQTLQQMPKGMPYGMPFYGGFSNGSKNIFC